MKILVVGGAGYIGAHVAWEFLKENHQVYVLDRQPEKLKGAVKDKAEIIEADILNYNKLVSILEKIPCDCVIHLAALKSVGESMTYPQRYSYNNLIASLNLINAMSQVGLDKIIFSSSAAIYGNPCYLPIDEKHPKDPQNYYGFTKLKIEECLDWYSRLGKLRYLAFRYFNAAGYDREGKVQNLEHQPTNLIPVIMEAAFGLRERVNIFGTDYPTPDGTCVRDYIHVSDLAQAHIKGLHYLKAESKSLAINLGSQKALSVKEVFTKATKVVGHYIPSTIQGRRLGDPAMLYADSSLAKQKLNWVAQYSDLDTLLESTYKAYQTVLKTK